MARQLTAVFEKHEDWYVAYLEEIPGVNTQGKTMEESRVNLEDTLREFLEANRHADTYSLLSDMSDRSDSSDKIAADLNPRRGCDV